ncbi:hypothetical protein AB0L75_40790 [Streptomyces sp. NPDC052101]|uniref:hypothetical protein n=1 Tax=Streptomyces sp. NPDC052101 TaxID=3155763 RepID=UPI00342F07C4
MNTMHGGGGFSGGGHHGGGFSGHHHSGGVSHHHHHHSSGLSHHGNHHHHTGDWQSFAWIPLFRRREPSGHSTGVHPKRVTLGLGVLLIVGIVVWLLAAH